MRGSIWTVVALGVAAVMTPLILDVDVSGDSTGQTALELLSSVDLLVGLAFVVVVFGLLIKFIFTDSY
jgi:hypothetical protein